MAQNLGRNRKPVEAGLKVGSHTSIIQCPSCQTKFAVRTAAIEEQKTPRFHCSRCDHLFSLDEILVTQPAPLKKSASLVAEPRPPLDRVEDEGFPAPENEEYFEEPEEAEPEEDSYNFEEDEEGRAIEEEDRKNSPWRFAPPAAERSEAKKEVYRETQITFPFEDKEDEPAVPFVEDEEDEDEEEYIGSPLSWMDKVLPLHEKQRPPAPPAAPDVDADWLAELRPKNERRSGEAGEEAVEQPKILRKNIPSAPPSAPEEPVAERASVASPQPERTERKPLFREVSSSTSKSKGPVQTTIIDAQAYQSQERKPRTILFVMVPLIGALFVLCVLSFFTISDPATLRRVVSSSIAKVPAIPPAGLFISDVQFKQITLDNNSEIPALTGRVVNKSASTFKDVVIIAGLFDKRGSTIIEAKTNLSSPLHQSRLKSISPDMLPKLMTEGRSKTFKLKPGEETNFVLPFIEATTGGKKITKAPAHFAAKVFSVTE